MPRAPISFSPSRTWSANYKVNESNPEKAGDWLKSAVTHEGSWWPDWTGWLGERSGEERDAPREPGSDDYPVLGEAPGTYVRQ
jgi:polyhydroxyalkanoate synthase